jgi:hypothetical protein
VPQETKKTVNKGKKKTSPQMKKEKSISIKLQNSAMRSSESPVKKPTTPVQARKPIHRITKPSGVQSMNRSLSNRSDGSNHGSGVTTPRDKVKKKLVLGAIPAAKNNYNVTVKRVQFSLLDGENRSQSTLS